MDNLRQKECNCEDVYKYGRKICCPHEKCDAIVKKTNKQCDNKGIYPQNNEWYCGLHVKDKNIAEEILKNTRLLKNIDNYENIKLKIIEYTAGFLDADGCFKCSKTNNSYHIYISATQSEKGVSCLHFLWNNFGGSVILSYHAQGNRQTQYTWKLNGQYAINFCKIIINSIILKKREVIIISQFPILHINKVKYAAENNNEIIGFEFKKN